MVNQLPCLLDRASDVTDGAERTALLMKQYHTKVIFFLMCLSMALGLGLPLGSAAASTLIAIDLDGLTRRSDTICTGTVIDATSFMEGGRIFTLNRVRVDETMHGTSNGTILEVVTAGGHGEHFSQKVFGAAELTPGEQYLLFLEPRRETDEKRVVGMAQGALRISLSTADNVKMVHPLTRGVRIAEKNPSTGRIVEVLPWIREASPLDLIKRNIADAIARLK